MGWSRGACAARRGTRQEVMSGAATSVKRGLRQAAGVVLDFALPPRCVGCAEVIDEIDGFCAACWSAVHWIGGDARRADAARRNRGRTVRGGLAKPRPLEGCARRWHMASCRERSRFAWNTTVRSRFRGQWRDSWRRCAEPLRAMNCWCRYRCTDGGFGRAGSISRR